MAVIHGTRRSAKIRPLKLNRSKALRVCGAAMPNDVLSTRPPPSVNGYRPNRLE
jgi:hypothetical protein